MRKILFCIALLVCFAVISCARRQSVVCKVVNGADPTGVTGDYKEFSLEKYRETLIGKFNGVDIDTLIAEPLGVLHYNSETAWIGTIII